MFPFFQHLSHVIMYSMVSNSKSANNSKIQSKLRQSNIELLRIVLMLLIIAHHYVVNSGLMSIINNHGVGPRSIFLLSISAFGKIAINCFVLVTGYYMCKSRITMKKFLKFILEVLFYYIVIYLVFVFMGYAKFSLQDFFIQLLPVKSITTDFTSAYIVLFLLIPFINIFIKNISKRQHLTILAILLFIYTILGNIPIIHVSLNYVSWFFIVYLIGSYLRLYPTKLSTNKKFWCFTFISTTFLSILSVILGLVIHQTDKTFFVYYFVADSNKILAVITSISVLMFFKNLNIKYNKYINWLAASTFGVLLIHAHGPIMRRWLWNDLFKNPQMYGETSLPLHAVCATLIVYISCIIIDKLRIYLIEQPLFSKLSSVIKKTKK